MAKITYTNKVALNENPEIALINKVTDDDLNEIKSVVNTNDDNVGVLTNLTTTAKTNIVAAINEVNSGKASGTDLGDISDLTTTDKTSAVNAINELNSDKAADDIILVQSTEPSSDTNILWINNGEIGTPASEITNEYSTSTGKGYSANYLNDKIEWEDITSQISMKTGYTLSSGKLFKKGKHVMGNIVVSGTFTQNTLATILELPYKADGEHITFCAFSDGAYSAKSLGYLYFVKNLSVSPNTTGQTYVNLELNYITE